MEDDDEIVNFFNLTRGFWDSKESLGDTECDIFTYTVEDDAPHWITNSQGMISISKREAVERSHFRVIL